MAVWLQADKCGPAVPAGSARVALALLDNRTTAGLEPLLLPSIPAVDGVVRLPGSISAGLPPDCLAYDHLLCLRPGENLLASNDLQAIRRTAQRAATACLLPVHYPTGSELTLLGLEPRWVAVKGDASAAMGFFPLPIESAAPPPAVIDAARPDLAWAVLARAIRALLAGNRSMGFAALVQLYGQTVDRARAIAGLVVRNGLAAALTLAEADQAATWLTRVDGYGGYAEIGLLRALVPYVRGEWSAAVAALTGVIDGGEATGSGPWISGGGERSYRALAFRGHALARLGALDLAVSDWSAALRACPDYLPPLRAIARHRLHAEVLDRLGLRRFWRGRPAEAAALVVRVYAQSSHPEAAAAILAAQPDLPVSKAVRRAVRRPHGGGGARSGAQRGPAPGIRWEGPFFTASSLARVNRELARYVLGWGWDLGAVPTEPHSYAPDRDAEFGALARRLWHRPDDVAVTVRHRWPPSFAPVGSGRLVVVLPWEYGPIPRRWVDQMEHVAEVWVYSEWVRRGVIASGIDPERVHVVPCGFDPLVFRPEAGSAGQTGDPMQFLYVGGTIPRKGYDLALAAFLAEFGPDEPATLTIKDFGAASFYRGSHGTELVRAAAAETAAVRRKVHLIESVLADDDLATLYRSADALMAPYRAEGFCLPALEAMACGTPAILPRAGPALDYATPETALLLEAAVTPAGNRIDGMALAGEGLICEMPLSELRRAMRWAYEHRGELRTIGRRAAHHVRARFTWEHCARVAAERLNHLVGSREGAVR